MENLLQLRNERLKIKVFHSRQNWTPLILRVLLGVVIFPHGAQKLLGWFGGYGFSGTMAYFTDTVGLPWLMALAVILLEFFGSLMLIAGLLVRPLALSFTGLAMGIILSAHLEHGFFMNWYGAQTGEGIEYFVLWIGMSISLLISGSGRYALDRLIISE